MQAAPDEIQALQQAEGKSAPSPTSLRKPVGERFLRETLPHGGSFLWFGDPVLWDGDRNRHFQPNGSTAAGTSPQIMLGLVSALSCDGCRITRIGSSWSHSSS